jgi:DNA anti-recombination protein RmuC
MTMNRTTIWICTGLLAGVAGGLMTLGCERRDEPREVAAAPPAAPGPADTGVAASDAMKRQIAELQRTAATAQNDAQREIDQARDKLAALPEEARQELNTAIDRAERARDDLSDRVDEIEESGDARWEATRQRVSDAIDELAEARREVAAALRGDTNAG